MSAHTADKENRKSAPAPNHRGPLSTDRAETRPYRSSSKSRKVPRTRAPRRDEPLPNCRSRGPSGVTETSASLPPTEKSRDRRSLSATSAAAVRHPRHDSEQRPFPDSSSVVSPHRSSRCTCSRRPAPAPSAPTIGPLLRRRVRVRVRREAVPRRATPHVDLANAIVVD